MAKKITKIEPVKQQTVSDFQVQLRVCAYCRVSTDSREQHHSFSTQVEYYTKLIGKRDDWKYVGIYADEARSGTKTQKRDEFLRMMCDCEAGRIDMIITKSVTRFARNTVDSIQAIRRLKELGIAVFFEKENINTLSEQSEVMVTILSSLAQGESESISTNNKWSAVRRFRKGTFIIGCPAYGYTKDEDGEMIIDEADAAVIRRIFKDYLNGKGSYAIAKELETEKVPIIRNAEKWQDGVIKGILQNPVYAGDLLLQKTFTTDVLPFQRKANKGQQPQYFIESNHEPIVTRQQAEAVREIYEYRRNQMGMDGSDKYQNRYAFSSKIICGECGTIFRRQKIYIGKPYEKIQWCCRQHIEDSSKCRLKAVREDIIKWAFTTMWNKLVSNYDEILLPLLESLKALRVDQEQEKQIGECNNRIMELTEQSHILSRVISKGYIDSAVFVERQNVLMQEITAAKKKRASLLDNSGFDKEIVQTERLLELIRNNPTIIVGYDEKLFFQAVDQIIIQKNQIIFFRLKNSLELSEYFGKEADTDDAATYANRL